MNFQKHLEYLSLSHVLDTDLTSIFYWVGQLVAAQIPIVHWQMSFQIECKLMILVSLAAHNDNDISKFMVS